MYKRHRYDIIVILAVVALSISLYLAFSHYLGFVVPCDITKGCETVLSSKYAMLLGLPLSVWGAGYFAAVIISALLANHYDTWKKLLTILLSVGAFCALIFLFLQFFVIKKVCQYCLTTDLLGLLILVLDLNIEHQL